MQKRWSRILLIGLLVGAPVLTTSCDLDGDGRDSNDFATLVCNIRYYLLNDPCLGPNLPDFPP